MELRGSRANKDFSALPGQEVIYSKVLRKMMKELVMFSLVTSATDVGAGAYGAPPNYRDLDFR